MIHLDIRSLLGGRLARFALAGFFLVGGSVNVAGPSAVLAQYHGWGYPGWFHYLTGGLELSTAALLAFRPTHLVGAALGSCVMAAAAATLLVHQEGSHATLPLCILALLIGSAVAAGRD